MNARRRPYQHGPHPRTGPSVLGEAIILDRIAQVVRAELRQRRLDYAPLPELAAALGVDSASMHSAAARHSGLGVIEAAGQESVWSLPTAPISAGFRPTLLDGRLALRLPVDQGGRPLLISGRYLGAPATKASPADPATPVGGELGYTIMRMTMMAQRWLALPAEGDRARHLFELIARTWRNSPKPSWVSGDLHVHHFNLHRPVGVPYWNGDSPTSHLELVVWAEEESAPELVNVYPSGTHRSIFGTGESK